VDLCFVKMVFDKYTIYKYMHLRERKK